MSTANSITFLVPSAFSGSARRRDHPAAIYTALKCQTIHTPTTARGTQPLETAYCSNLGLESSWPSGLASWIKRLDCASSYSSTSRFPPLPAGPPNYVEVRSSYLIQITLTCAAYQLSQATLACLPLDCDLARVARVRGAYKADSAEILCKTRSVCESSAPLPPTILKLRICSEVKDLSVNKDFRELAANV